LNQEGTLRHSRRIKMKGKKRTVRRGLPQSTITPGVEIIGKKKNEE